MTDAPVGILKSSEAKTARERGGGYHGNSLKAALRFQASLAKRQAAKRVKVEIFNGTPTVKVLSITGEEERIPVSQGASMIFYDGYTYQLRWPGVVYED